MKILFVCMQYIHSARWINQLKDSEHEVFVFDCLDKKIHDELRWTNFTENWSKRKISYIKGEYWLEKNIPTLFKKIEPILKVTASQKLIEIINEIQPDLVHSLEMQSETYPLVNVRKKINFTWAYSCWGNDIYYYKNLGFHQKIIKNTLERINYCFLECVRDEKLIKSISNKSKILGTRFPGGGGYKINQYKKYFKPVNERNLIIIKGYEHKFGRALNVLKALELIIEDLNGIDIYVYSAHEIIIEKIGKLNQEYNLNIEYSSRYNQLTHHELLEKFGKAKIAVGNNVSDGIPNTLLESIICGAFPIQSNPGGVTEEYITVGENGYIISNPENVSEIASKIKSALKNTELLKKSIKKNRELAKQLEYSKIKKEVLLAYQQIENELV